MVPKRSASANCDVVSVPLVRCVKRPYPNLLVSIYFFFRHFPLEKDNMLEIVPAMCFDGVGKSGAASIRPWIPAGRKIESLANVAFAVDLAERGRRCNLAFSLL